MLKMILDDKVYHPRVLAKQNPTLVGETNFKFFYWAGDFDDHVSRGRECQGQRLVTHDICQNFQMSSKVSL